MQSKFFQGLTLCLAVLAGCAVSYWGLTRIEMPRGQAAQNPKADAQQIIKTAILKIPAKQQPPVAALNDRPPFAKLTWPKEARKAIEEAVSSQATELWLWCAHTPDLTDADFELLGKATSLERLRFDNCDVEDRHMPYLGRLTNLKELYIRNSRLGGGFEHLAGLEKLEVLDVSDNIFIRNADVQHLTQLPNLQELNLSRSGVDDHGCRVLAGMKQLRALNLTSTQVTDAGIIALSGLQLYEIGIGNKVTNGGVMKIPPTVRSLIIDSCNNSYFREPSINWVPIAALSRTHPQMERLYLLGPSACDESLEWASSMKELKQLTVIGDMTDRGLAHIARLGKLETLGLSGHKMTDAGVVKAIEGRSRLRMLWIAGDQVTDAIVPTLKQLDGLVHLSLDGTAVSDQGLDQLRGALTDCEVSEIRDVSARVRQARRQGKKVDLPKGGTILID